MARGLSLESARNYSPIGCVEPGGTGDEWPACGGTGSVSYLNLVNGIWLGINDGYLPIPLMFGAPKAVSYTHLDVYKRQLPNVGKSTLFNAITNAGAESANYPFCTIDPNVGTVAVPDERLDFLADMYSPKKYTPAVIEFVDIAGLVKGASKGERCV